MKKLLMGIFLGAFVVVVNCTTTIKTQPNIGVPILNEKITVGPQLTGKACETRYFLFPPSNDFKGYGYVTGSESTSMGRGTIALNVIAWYISVPVKLITGKWLLEGSSGRHYSRTERAALYDALSKAQDIDELINPRFSNDVDKGFFSTKVCTTVQARGITLN